MNRSDLAKRELARIRRQLELARPLLGRVSLRVAVRSQEADEVVDTDAEEAVLALCTTAPAVVSFLVDLVAEKQGGQQEIEAGQLAASRQ